MQARAEAPCVHSTIDRDSERSRAAKSQVRELDASTRSHSRSSRDKRRKSGQITTSFRQAQACPTVTRVRYARKEEGAKGDTDYTPRKRGLDNS